MTRSLPLRVSRFARLVHVVAVAMFAGTGTATAQNCIWLNQNPDDGGLFATKNPAPGVVVGHSTELYIWISKNTAIAGYDGISLDVHVESPDGGQVDTEIAVDNEGARWDAVYGGTPLPGTGGTGIDNANAIDLTNTDTTGTDPFRFARLTFTGRQVGTVRVFLGIGDKGVADNGTVPSFYIGMIAEGTTPESPAVSGGNYGATSSIPEAVITVLSGPVGDYDDDSDVDLADFAVFGSCFNGPNRLPAQPGCAGVDADGDSDVDLTDFAQFQACFNGPNRKPACG